MGNSDSKVVEKNGGGHVEGEEVSRARDDSEFPAESRDDDNTIGPQFIQDDQVQVNLPMVDLMAYLQVVANNSNRLPRSRRDGVQTDEFETTPTEVYAQKSAAFIPTDIRIIGAIPNGYIRTGDLPEAADYHIGSQATEPGRSYGGACTNSMLKVLYDAASEEERQITGTAPTMALFDDDDDEEEDSSVWMGRSFRSNYSLEQETPSGPSLSFGELLRRMKAEMLESEYAQIPKFTSSRRVDLNRPFTLLSDSFDHRKNKKRSLLIGCNYHSSGAGDLKASHDDIRSMKDYVVNVHGFPETKDSMMILLDDDIHQPPTFENIVNALKKISEESQEGDAVFIHFSGHGGRVLVPGSDDTEPGYDEVLVPCDYQKSGLIRDTLIFKTLFAPLKFGVTCTFLVDACLHGMMIELPYAWSTKVEKSESIVAPNQDFSFLRSLKVVKTLYETSAFTQVGKGIGSALPPSPENMTRAPPPRHSNVSSAPTLPSIDIESTLSGGSFTAASPTAQPSPRQSWFESITDACSARNRKNSEELVEIMSSNSHLTAKSKRKGANSFFDMIRCPGNEEAVFSDEEGTFRTEASRTYYGWENERVSSLESFDYSPQSRQRGRSRRRR